MKKFVVLIVILFIQHSYSMHHKENLSSCEQDEFCIVSLQTYEYSKKIRNYKTILNDDNALKFGGEKFLSEPDNCKGRVFIYLPRITTCFTYYDFVCNVLQCNDTKLSVELNKLGIDASTINKTALYFTQVLKEEYTNFFGLIEYTVIASRFKVLKPDQALYTKDKQYYYFNKEVKKLKSIEFDSKTISSISKPLGVLYGVGLIALIGGLYLFLKRY